MNPVFFISKNRGYPLQSGMDKRQTFALSGFVFLKLYMVFILNEKISKYTLNYCL